jgi:hypothetical protein
MRSISSINALAQAARSCIREAAYADRTGQRRYAAQLRASARTALRELKEQRLAMQPSNPKEMTAAQKIAAVIINSYGRRTTH